MIVKTALFVDFDNIYIRLNQQDKTLADRFGNQPDTWLSWLEGALPVGYLGEEATGRRILVRKCYLNPRSFYTYRPFFIRSAFEVVDCPPLTGQGKTSSDIRLVMDVLDSLVHPTYYDEFILFTADADFTHLLLRLRQHDRRSAVLAVGPASAALRSSCDYWIDEDDFSQAILGIEKIDDRRTQPVTAGTPKQSLKEIADFVHATVSDSDSPVVMAHLAHAISKKFGKQLLKSDWMGNGSFKKFLSELELSGLEISAVMPGYIYDPARHQPPEVQAPSDEFMDKYPHIAPLARTIKKLTDTPYLMPEYYAGLFGEIADEINTAGYHFNNTSKNIRDRCIEKDLPISRATVNSVLRGISFSGHNLGSQAQSVGELSEALVKNTYYLCEAAQMDLSESQHELIREWLSVEDTQPASPPHTPDPVPPAA